jgi:adenylosuccinate lyase
MKGQAVAVPLAKREEGAGEKDLFNRLAADGRLGLPKIALVADRAAFVGAAPAQIQAVPYARRPSSEHQLPEDEPAEAFLP